MNTNYQAWNSCFRKRLFWTEDAAKEYAMRLWSQHGATLEVYPCEIGQQEAHFHVGHKPRVTGKEDKLRRLRTFGRQTVLTGA